MQQSVQAHLRVYSGRETQQTQEDLRPQEDLPMQGMQEAIHWQEGTSVARVQEYDTQVHQVRTSLYQYPCFGETSMPQIRDESP